MMFNIQDYSPLKELYTFDQFKVALQNDATILSLYGSYGTTIKSDNQFWEYLCYAVYNYYRNYRVAYKVKDDFEYRLRYNILSIIPHLYSKYKKFLELLADSDKLAQRGGLVSERDVQLDQERSNFTKQANTPTSLSPTSEFVNDYTDYQSDTTSKLDTNDYSKTELSRSGSVEDVLNVYDRLPKDFFVDAILKVNDNFITYFDLYEREGEE